MEGITVGVRGKAGRHVTFLGQCFTFSTDPREYWTHAFSLVSHLVMCYGGNKERVSVPNPQSQTVKLFKNACLTMLQVFNLRTLLVMKTPIYSGKLTSLKNFLVPSILSKYTHLCVYLKNLNVVFCIHETISYTTPGGHVLASLICSQKSSPACLGPRSKRVERWLSG